MQITLSYEDEFKKDFQRLKKLKHSTELLELDGIGTQLDLNKFSKDFFRKTGATTADVSVDSNSNLDNTNIVHYNNEIAKPIQRLNSYYILWKYARRLFNEDIAYSMLKKQLTKEVYINDFHGFASLPYCYNFSTNNILYSGLPYVKRIKSDTPKHFDTFLNQVLEFVAFACNNLVGAVGLADIWIVASYFYDKFYAENKDLPAKYKEKYIKQQIQSFVFRCNQLYRNSQQAPFTNVSLFDDVFLDKLCSEYTDFEGNNPNKESVKVLQGLFVKVMNETLSKTPCTFPVTTACFATDDDNNILDEKFLDFVSKHNQQFAFMNIYAGKTTTLSSCCFDKEQKILCKSSFGVMYDTLENIYNLPYEGNKNNFTVFHNGSWAKSKVIKTQPKENKLYKVCTKNNKEFSVTLDHLVPTLRGDVEAKDLKIDDYILFNNQALDTFPEKDLGLTYEQGYLLGLYIGDGSKYKRKDSNSFEVTLSLNHNDYDALPLVQKAMEQWGVIEKLHTYSSNNNVLFVKVYSEKLFDIIGEYVYGNYCYEKELNLEILLQSRDFRQGIIDGWYKSDGGNSNRIYTTSNKLIEHGELLFTSLGLCTIVNTSDRTGEGKVVINKTHFDRNYPLHCIRWYSSKNKRSMGDVYKVRNNSIYFKIDRIVEEEYNEDVYCIESFNQDEPYFTLPNGHITHNCRLRSDQSNEYFNTFGSGGTQIGSASVTTLNLPRLAYISDSKQDFLDKLKEDVVLVSQINHVRRYNIQKRVENNHAPLYEHGFMSLSKQYSTCGLNGINEAVEILGMDIKNEDGQKFVFELLDVVNSTNEKQSKKYKVPMNCEQTPSENSAIKLAQADKVLGYNNKYELYSNQFIPLTSEADIIDRIKLQGTFDKHMTGGAICHLNISDQIKDRSFMKKLIKFAIKSGVVYHAVNYNLQQCEDGCITVGKQEKCPSCGKKIVENYLRIVGFLTPISNWHQERRKEYTARQFYSSKNSSLK